MTATVAATVLALSVTASASETYTDVTLSSVTVQVTGMVDVRYDVPASAIPTETFTVIGRADELDALVDARVKQFQDKQDRRVRPVGGGANPLNLNTVFGNCGASYVELRATGSYVQGQGYLRAGWNLSRSYVKTAGVYTSDVLVYSNSSLDGWTAHFKNAGTMVGLDWERDTRVTIPKKQEYGAHMVVGTVAITRVSDGQPSTCSTKGPRVDNILIYK